MKLPVLLLACAASAAPAIAQNGWQQTQGQSGQSSYGSGNDFGNSWRSNESQTGNAASSGQSMRQAQGTPGEVNDLGNKRAKKATKISDPRKSDDGESAGSDDGTASGDERADAPAKIDLATARENFPGLVETYVTNHSPKGYWSYVEKKGAKPRHLSDPAVDGDSLRKVRDGRFAARVKLRDERSRKPFALEFEADFSGTDWRIAAVRPVSSRR